MSKDTSGPVFPCRIPTGAYHACDEPPPTAQHYGMTLRDYVAAKAMAAQIVAIGGMERGNSNQALELAVCSYEMADAMLKAREA